MSEREDEDLRKLLRQWEAPPAGSGLDARVWSAVRESVALQRRSRVKKWLPIAAGVVLVAGSASVWLARPHGVSLETTTDATGFRPLSNGTITIVKAGGRQ